MVKSPAWKVGDFEFQPHSDLSVSKKQMFLPRLLVMIQYYGELP